MKIAVTGSSGLIGSALVDALQADGHSVRQLVRHAPRRPQELSWTPGIVDPASVDGTDAVVHLAGAGVGDHRWSASWQAEVLTSRVDGTTSIARSIAACQHPPRILLSASGVGWYGDTGDREVDETAPAGDGFLADVVRRWEAATAPAVAAGVRVCALRSGIVLSAAGGALGKVLPLFRFGVGGRLGSGQQWMPWITLADEVAAIRFLLDAEVSGPVNLTTGAVTNADYTRALSRALHRPAVLPVPGFALRLVLGGFADEGVLTGQRVRPAVLTRSGFLWSHPDLNTGLAAVLG
ncbi:MAG: TIGR01777 family oxidoreductase [Frankiaceae bacterium]